MSLSRSLPPLCSVHSLQLYERHRSASPFATLRSGSAEEDLSPRIILGDALRLCSSKIGVGGQPHRGIGFVALQCEDRRRGSAASRGVGGRCLRCAQKFDAAPSLRRCP